MSLITSVCTPVEPTLAPVLNMRSAHNVQNANGKNLSCGNARDKGRTTCAATASLAAIENLPAFSVAL